MRATDSVRQKAEDAGQGHLLQCFEALDDESRRSFSSELQATDFRWVAKLLEASLAAAARLHSEAEPIDDSRILTSDTSRQSAAGFSSSDVLAREDPLLRRGLELIAEGKVAAVCLAGGQGTRLGSSEPKGLFDIGLPSRKSLFQIQAERIQRLQKWAAEAVLGSEIRQALPFVILTSPATDERTRQFFSENSNFGLELDQLLFAVQDELPCLEEDGKLILATQSSIAKAPDGNGGFYGALVKSGVLAQLEERGVQFVDCYCVDNALARVADPHLAGHASLTKADVCAKVLAKAYPEEKVGVFVERDGAAAVVEYSELDPAEASAPDPGTGRLKYNWANISHFCFTPAFIRRAAEHIKASGEYHIARKKIPSINGPVQGIKLESFIFDPFPLARNLQLMEVERASHFAPVKNANGAAADTPDAAREAVLKLHRRWLSAEGGRLHLQMQGTEISPSRSYLGEGLFEAN